MGTVLWIAGTLWISLLTYNFITALFGINTFRVYYINLLRWLYRVRLHVSILCHILTEDAVLTLLQIVGMKSSLKGDNMERRNSDGVCVCVCVCFLYQLFVYVFYEVRCQ